MLVVEDDTIVREFVATALRNLGYEILEAEDGATAIDLLEKTPKIDLLFTDLVLPRGMDGKVVAKKFQQKNSKIKVLYTSGYSKDDIAHQGSLDASELFLSKPYKIETLARKVRASLDC